MESSPGVRLRLSAVVFVSVALLVPALGDRHASAQTGEEAEKKLLARQGYAVSDQEDLLADPAGARIYVQGRTRNGAATLALDAADFSLRAVSPITGRLSLEERRRRLLVDDPQRGLHVLAVPGLREQLFIPLPPAAFPDGCRGNGRTYAAPAVDATTGLAYVARDSTVYLLDPGTGREVGTLDDVGRSGGDVMEILVDGPGKRLFLAQLSSPGGPCLDKDVVTVLALPSHRVVAHPKLIGSVDWWFSNTGELTVVSGYYWPPRSWLSRLRDGVMRKQEDWGGLTSGFLPDLERHRFLAGYDGTAYWVDARTFDTLAALDLPGWPRALYRDGDRVTLITTHGGALGRLPVAPEVPPAPSQALDVVRPLKISLGEVVGDGAAEPMLLAGAELSEQDFGSCLPEAESRAEDPPRARLVRQVGEAKWRNLDAGLACSVSRGPVVLSPAFDRDGIAFRTSGGFDEAAFRTEDRGRSWQPVGGGIDPWAVAEIAVSPAFVRDGLVLASAGQATYRSVDRGKTWRPVGDRFSGFAFAPSFPADRRICALTPELDKVLQSTDGGRSWRPLAGPSLPEEPRRVLSRVAPLAAPGAPGGMALFAVTEVAEPIQTYDPPFFQADGQLILERSTDGGRTWQPVLGPLGQQDSVHRLFSATSSNGPVILASLLNFPWPDWDKHSYRILRSDDLGRSWREWRPPAGIQADSLTTRPDGTLVSIRPDGQLQPVDLGAATPTATDQPHAGLEMTGPRHDALSR